MTRTSMVGGISNAVNLVMAFVYRTVFIRLLSVQYLGVTGLFTNLLDLLSLAELGVSAAISYRLYEPISRGDADKAGALMRYFKRIYRRIAAVILAAGLLMLPFLEVLVRDLGEIPNDVDLRLIYLLFLGRTVLFYMLCDPLLLLMADQRDDIRLITDAVMRTLIYVLQIVSLLIWRQYTISIAVAVAVTVAEYALLGGWVRRRYREVFAVHTMPDRETRRAIGREMAAGGNHRIGAVILASTDQLVLTRFVSLTAAGLYGNYAMIMGALKTMILQLMTSSTASLGHTRAAMDDAENQRLYQRMLTLNLALSGFAAFCLHVLINDFIGVWLGAAYQFSVLTVSMLCLQLYLDTARFVTDAYINACGLFVRDRYRPFVEAGLNITISIVLAIRFGVAGVFMGTAISFLATAFWRAPQILCRWGLHCSTSAYWRRYLTWTAFTVICCLLAAVLPIPTAHSWLQWLIKAMAAACLYLALAAILFGRDECIRGLLTDVKRLIDKRKAE